MIALHKHTIMSSDQHLLINCSGCGYTPCAGHRLCSIGIDYKAHTGNHNKAVRFQLYKMHIRETYGVLGRGQRIPLPHCVDAMIKEKFPNEDGSACVGFKEAWSFNVMRVKHALISSNIFNNYFVFLWSPLSKIQMACGNNNKNLTKIPIIKSY